MSRGCVVQTQVGLTSYKFDAGEVNWLPKFCRTRVPMENPNTYTVKYVTGVLARMLTWAWLTCL